MSRSRHHGCGRSSCWICNLDPRGRHKREREALGEDAVADVDPAVWPRVIEKLQSMPTVVEEPASDDEPEPFI